MQLKINKRGDTIIEVLLSIAIAGFVISGAYALSSHSLQEGVSAAERTEANKLAESQIEALKYREKTAGNTWDASFSPTVSGHAGGFANIPSGQSFCLDSSAVSDTLSVGGINQPNTAWLPQVNTGNPTVLTTDTGQANHYNTPCVSPQLPGTPKYFISITANTDSTDKVGTVFEVDIRWSALGNGNTSESQLFYKLPPVVLP